jgi:hypothetical protein
VKVSVNAVLGLRLRTARYMAQAPGRSSAKQLFQISEPLELVTTNEGEVGPTVIEHVAEEMLVIETVIFTRAPGP